MRLAEMCSCSQRFVSEVERGKQTAELGRAVGYTGDVRTLFEIQNQKECHELLLGPMLDLLRAEAVKTWRKGL